MVVEANPEKGNVTTEMFFYFCFNRWGKINRRIKATERKRGKMTFKRW